MLKVLRLLFSFLAVFILTISCGKDSSTGHGDDDTSNESVISEKTKVIEQEENLTLDTVKENTLTYSYTGSKPDISTGDILVSVEGDGYLRKVTDVSTKGDKITVETEQAALTDAVVQGDADTTITLDFTAQKIGTEGVFKAVEGVSLSKNGIDLSGVELYSGKIYGSDVSVTITDGSIVFEPDLDIGFKIRKSKVEEFHAIAWGSLQFNFDIAAFASGGFEKSDEITLFSYTHAIFQMVGFVPVMEVITFEFKAGFEAESNTVGSLETGFDQTTQVRAGAEYKEGKWENVWEKSAELTKHDTTWPQKADFRFKGYVRPVVSVKLYAVAGPYIDVVPYLDFDGSTGGEYAWQWELSGGIESNLGFNVSVLGYGIADYSTNLVAWETVIASDYQESNGGGGEPHEYKNITFVTIPGGTFKMGNIENDPDGYSDEKPVHSVTLSGFDMSTTEVTNAQYAVYLNEALASGDITATISSVTGKTGDYSGREYLDLDDSACEISYSNSRFSIDYGKEDRPVIEVTWYGSKAFALYYGLDLPTESEWEYACRGGKQHKYGTDDGTINSSKANYNRNVDNTTDVGSYPANPYGLYDMSGNVWEWCHDWYGSYSSASATNPTGAHTGSYRVDRGGSWCDSARYCRSAFRSYNNPCGRVSVIGFRVVSRGVSY
ncbi:MAG: formylglycine-generating enzyme family protein [Candidatus Latescibacteria bacterium]|nr:formylglycine-generating enzyme family protein [Candidatus Latescibacterota bacterium]